MHKDGPCLVTACPGSGKTRVVVERTAQLVQSGVPPHQILSITFTNKAAEEMKKRIAERLGDAVKQLVICTIHAWCARCLRRYGNLIGYPTNFTIIDEDEQTSLLIRIAKEQNVELSRPMAGKLASVMDDCREKLLDEEEMGEKLERAGEEAWSTIAETYLEDLRKKHRLDFSGLLTETLRVLREKPEALKAIQDRFHYIQVDETQDTNPVQYFIIELIGDRTKNIMIVGDADQCQPAGTLVMTSIGDFKKIEDIDPEVDRLVCFDRFASNALGWINKCNHLNRGYRFKVASRKYTGLLYKITACGVTSLCTWNHKWPVRIDRQSKPEKDFWVVYLMQHGNRFRIGQCSFYGKRQYSLGFGVRCRLEKAQNAWVLSIHETKQDALCREEALAAKYGITTICFEQHAPGYNRAFIDEVFSQLDPSVQEARARQCLENHGRKFDSPFFVNGKFTKDGHRCSRNVEACNLLPLGMQIPFNLKTRGLSTNPKKCSWTPIESIETEWVVDLDVYSLDVEKYHNYITDGGLITCNSIYAFRGARPANITDFIRVYHPRVIRLGQNYRSTPQIVAVADKLIRHNPERPADDFRTCNADGPPVQCRCFNYSEDESKWLGDQIHQAIQRGLQPKQIAVLYRLNRMSRSIEQQLMYLRIPYVVVGGMSFFDRQEVKDCLAMLRMLNSPSDDLAFERIIGRPKRGIGETALSRIEAFAEKEGISLADACCRSGEYLKPVNAQPGAKAFGEALRVEWKSLTVADCLKTLIQRLGYEEYLNTEFDREKCMDRLGNVNELIVYAAKFGQAEKGLANFLDHVSLMTSADKAEKKSNAVQLSTIHCAKGLQYHTVFIPGVEQGILPHKMAVDDNPLDGIQEERRVLYVGMTRAEKNLILTYSRFRATGYGRDVQYQMVEPSQFLYESGLLKQQTNDIEQDSLKKAYEQEEIGCDSSQ